MEAFEAAAPADVPLLHWVMLSTLLLEDAAAACERLRWYEYRWLMEQYHRVLKSGCRIEAL